MIAQANGSVGWVVDVKSKGRQMAELLIVAFNATIPTLFKENDHQTLVSLLTILEKNIRIARKIKAMVDAGATPGDIEKNVR